MKKLFVRWALRQIKKNVHGAMTYHELSKWGIGDIVQIAGDSAYVLDYE